MWYNSVLFLLIPLCCCLRITEVHVPSIIDIRDHAELRCAFDLGTFRLNSVKWYKDDQEFFRFMPIPNSQPVVSTFHVKGVYVQESFSNGSLLTLYPLNYSSTGVYQCEVSTEGPHFKIASKSANMTVLGIPRQPPKITGIAPMYSVGDEIIANCTTDPSKPTAQVAWFINDALADQWLLENYRFHESHDPFQLESTAVELRFKIKTLHFQRNVFTLTCAASVQGLVKTTSVNVPVAELRNQKFAQEHSRFNGVGRTYSRCSFITFVFVYCSWKLPCL